MQVGDRLVGRFEQHAVGVEELERQRDDGVGKNVHRRSLEGRGWQGSGGHARPVSRDRAVRREASHCSAADRLRLAIIGRWLPRLCAHRLDCAGRRRPAARTGYPAAAFLQRHWQKDALLVRRAIAGLRRTVRARASSSRSRVATTSSRASSCARVRAGRSRTARSAAPTSRRFPHATGRCWCRASIWSSPPATRCCAASRSCRSRASTT